MMTMNALKRTLAGSLAAITLASAPGAHAQMGPGEFLGTLGGALLGGVAGSRFGQGPGKVAMVGVGMIAGAWAGHKFGEYLDRREQEECDDARYEALSRRRTRSWSNRRKGFEATFIPGRQVYPVSRNYTSCQEYTSRIWMNGRSETHTQYACSDSYGNWSDVRRDEITWQDPWGGQHTRVDQQQSWGNNGHQVYNPQVYAPTSGRATVRPSVPVPPALQPSYNLLDQDHIDTMLAYFRRLPTREERLGYVQTLGETYGPTRYRFGYGQTAQILGSLRSDEERLTALQILAPLTAPDGNDRDVVLNRFRIPQMIDEADSILP